jgi:hypothetical protein
VPAQRLAQLHGLGALGGAQVAVARAERQAVLGAAGVARDDLDGQSELAHHLADHHQLLVVLAPEHGAARAAAEHAGKELHHHRAHAHEEPGTEVPLEDVGDLRIGVHLEGLRLGVQVVLARREQHVAAGGLQLGAVGVPGARVAVEVLVRQELQPVHEDAGDGDVAQPRGLAHEREVAVVQVAHGGHEGGAPAPGKGGAQVGDGMGDVHGVERKGKKGDYQACSASSGKRPCLTACT